MNPDRLAAVSFGATLAVVVALRLNTAGMVLVATALLGALLLCPLLALRTLTTGTTPPDVRIERPVHAALSGPRGAAPRLLVVRHRPARRGGWPAWPRAYPLAPPARWRAVGAVAAGHSPLNPHQPESAMVSESESDL